MADTKVEIVEKGGSWAYRIGGMDFGSYPSREAALIASVKHEGEHPEPAVESPDRGVSNPGNSEPS